MRIASVETIYKSTQTRKRYAYNALERDSMLGLDNAEEINEIFTRFLKGETTKAEEIEWALREQEYLFLIDGN